ncbi:MAG TPA: 6-carboxytetrahydropterin synthase QueD [Syntrophales bacterium]|nr:6-carboxytetrahydropterin synthase QueD [Syntrophales bacterium]
MYEVTIKLSFSAAHRLKEIGSIYEKLHGHNFIVEISVASRELTEAGILIDFRVLKGWAEEVLNDLDHKYLNEVNYFKNISPSSENIARFIYERIEEKTKCHNLDISRVVVWESEHAKITYNGAKQ